MNTGRDFIVSLQDSALGDLTCGGKAFGLWRLFGAGANVPPGIVVLGDVSEEETRRTIWTWLKADSISFPNGAYAVRSSALCEDSAQNSFAGMFDTFLNVHSSEVISKVLECQRSSQNQRVAAYSAQRAAPVTEVAVVIQRMVVPRAAGVCFTGNPVTGNLNEIVIEVINGLGDRLVAGAVTPEYWLIDTGNRIVEMRYSDETPTSQPILTYRQVCFVATEARRLARAFGSPLDIEFAFTDAELFFLQARPITTFALAA